MKRHELGVFSLSYGETYISSVRDLIQEIEQSQMPRIRAAADLVADSLGKGGVLHLFGTGHSHLLAEELFFRVGGLAPVNAIFEPSLMLHEGPAKSSRLEKVTGYAGCILDGIETRPDEVMIVISNSGINAVPVEMAVLAKERGLRVIALTSVKTSVALAPKNKHGLRLMEVAEIVLDNLADYGDVLVELPGSERRLGSGSTIAGAVILNALVVEVAARLQASGVAPPVYASSNLPGGAEYNAGLLRRYQGRIRSLYQYGGEATSDSGS